MGENRIPYRQPCRLGLSRMTIRVEMEEESDGKLEANLYKLRDVASVESIRDSVAITREVAMIKIRHRNTPGNRSSARDG
jgi:acetolactate synthase small subunit